MESQSYQNQLDGLVLPSWSLAIYADEIWEGHNEL